MVACALPLLTACGTPFVRTETVEVQVPVYVPLPSALLQKCETPVMPGSLTVADLMEYVLDLSSALESCNAQMGEIRELQPE